MKNNNTSSKSNHKLEDSEVSIKPFQMVLRCYVEKDGDSYYASCIDLCLNARADSPEDAKQKLSLVIRDYMNEALTVDREHFSDLVPRKSPYPEIIKYHTFMLMHRIRKLKAELFTEVLPLKPC